MQAAPLLQLVCTLNLCGLILTIQPVHYPALVAAGAQGALVAWIAWRGAA